MPPVDGAIKRGEERGRERDRKGKFAFQEHGFESGCNGGNGGGSTPTLQSW